VQTDSTCHTCIPDPCFIGFITSPLAFVISRSEVLYKSDNFLRGNERLLTIRTPSYSSPIFRSFDCYLHSVMRMSEVFNKGSALIRSSSFLKSMLIEAESPCRLTDKTMTSSMMKLAMGCYRVGVVLVLGSLVFRGEKSSRTRLEGASVELITPLLTGSFTI
jgi:hypothetical protein